MILLYRDTHRENGLCKDVRKRVRLLWSIGESAFGLIFGAC